MPKLSVIVPVYNEEKTIARVIEEVKNTKIKGMAKEIIVVDDFSTDGTSGILKKAKGRIKIFCHKKNMGKGAAVKTGINNSTGDIILIQDADLECDPQDYYALLQPIKMGLASVVYGSRFLDGSCQTMSFRHYFANRFLTFLANVFIGQSLTDMETCYKVFRREVLDGIEIKENRFGFEPEITAKIANKGYQIHEVPISYHPRTYCEGKKIKWKDGFEAIWCIIKYNLIG